MSRFSLGTTNFGWKTPEEDAVAIMDRAHERGINLFDTANIYGGPSNRGEAERMIGRWFGQGGGRRERTVLATKASAPFSDWPNDGKLSALNLRRSCDASLRRLNTDYIDIYQLHWFDPATPWDEIWDALQALRTQGKVIYAGAANFAGWQVAMAQETAWKRDCAGLVSVQAEYNLLNRGAEREVLPACAAYGIGVLTYSPLQGGVLGGVDEPSGDRRKAAKAGVIAARYGDRLDAYGRLCRDLGIEPARVAVSWIARRPGVSSVLIGPRTTEQLDGTLEAAELELGAQAVERLDEIFPAPEEFRSLWDL